MVKIDKLAKYVRHISKAKNLAKQIEKLKLKHKSLQEGIKTYKNKLKGHKSKDTRYIVFKKSKKSKKPKKYTTKKKSKKSVLLVNEINKHNNLNNITSKLLSRKSKIIQPDAINIPNMESNMESNMKSNMESIMKQQTNLQHSNISALGNDYIIAIPSYKRVDIIQTHTLSVLNKNKIKPDLITIFVANQEEYDIYEKAIPKNLYNNIVIGVLGLKNQRNFINDYYPEGKYIVEMDDDIKNIMQLVVNRDSSNREIKKTVKSIEDLDAFIRRAFEMCIESNIFLWGVYPLVNPYFMNYKVTTDLRFIVGPMWGMINRHRKDLKLTIDEKENSERTLQFWVADGIVLRFNNVGIETKYYKNKGGMQNEGKDRKIEALKSVYYLHKTYPELTKISLTKKSGMPEIKMRRDLKK